MPQIRRLVLDVLKPHQPNIIEVSLKISSLKGVSGVNCSLEEIDQETESIKITIEGANVPFDAVGRVIEECGAAIHSVDSVSSGEKLVDEVPTPQD